MKYYIDTKFYEYKKQPKVLGLNVGKPINAIELISMGIVSEDIPNTINTRKIGASRYVGRELLNNPMTSKEYYAICKEFDLKAAWNNEWLRENVLKPLVIEKLSGYSKTKHSTLSITKQYKGFKYIINKYGKTKKQIAEEIKDFISYKDNLYLGDIRYYNAPLSGELKEGMTQEALRTYEGRMEFLRRKDTLPEFYAYYADYDWVVFCWLFGKMIDLPKGFPMYCKNLKQMLDKEVYRQIELNNIENKEVYSKFDFELSNIKSLPNYPKQINEHNALDDAKWNKELHRFLSTL